MNVSIYKRNFSPEANAESIQKRIRSMWTENRSLSSSSTNDSITRLENLSNELFYEIFEYLDGCTIFDAFNHLNRRFDNLISCSTIPLKFAFNENNSKLIREYSQKMIVPNAHRLLSLNLAGESTLRSFFDHCTLNRSFQSLESIVLSRFPSNYLFIVLFYLNTLPRLYSLKLDLEEERSLKLSMILRLIFSLPVLKSCQLITNWNWHGDIRPLSFVESVNQKGSSIESFDLKHPITLNDLIVVLKYLPSIRYLTCDELFESSFTVTQAGPLDLPDLKYFSMKTCEMKFSELEHFLQIIGGKLQVFKLDLGFDTDYLDATRWEKLFRKSLPNLKRLDFLSDEIDLPDSISIVQYLNPFNSQFWIEQNYSLILEMNLFDIRLALRTREKQWFDFHRELENQFDRRYQIENRRKSNLFMELIGDSNDDSLFINDCSFLDEVKAMLAAVNFSQYRTKKSRMSIIVLIELIEKLSSLDSLVLSSPPLIHSKYIPKNKIDHYLSFPMNNYITKLKIGQTLNKADFEVLFNLFRRIEYLEIDVETTNELLDFSTIILNNQLRRLSNLRSVCFNIQNADETMVDKLKTTIDHRTLIENYRIHRRVNQIYLQWKRKHDDQ